MQRILGALCALFLGLAILIPALAASAQEVQVEVAQPTLHFLTADTGREDKKIEPSGVAPIADGSLLLVACDKNDSLLVVEAATAQVLTIFGASGDLTKRKLIPHFIISDISPRVEYRVTPFGKKFIRILDQIEKLQEEIEKKIEQ